MEIYTFCQCRAGSHIIDLKTLDNRSLIIDCNHKTSSTSNLQSATANRDNINIFKTNRRIKNNNFTSAAFSTSLSIQNVFYILPAFFVLINYL
jgi:hypothetical protein